MTRHQAEEDCKLHQQQPSDDKITKQSQLAQHVTKQ